MPEKVKSKRKSLLDPYKPFILHRLQQGCSNAMQLFREIRDQGYPGGHSIVRMFVADHRHLIQECASKPVTQMKYQKISPRTARGVIWKKESDLSEREKEILKLILESDENIRTIHKLVQSFRDIMDSRQAKQLEDWIKEAEICGIQELKGFVLGIRRDFDAVYASLSLEWSNGLVEGHIHRLKLIKRQMYGRANFDLLRNRVLYQE